MKKFTLIELMFTITVLIVLISMGFSVGTKVLRKQTDVQREAEMLIIRTAVIQYQERFGVYPSQSDGEIDFAASLSPAIGYKTPSGEWDYSLRDSMNWLGQEINYDIVSGEILDPYEEKYKIQYSNGGFEIK